MAITKEKKKKILEDLKEKIANQKAIVLVGITGLKVKDLSSLRKKLKAVDAKMQVAKKSLVSLALKEANLNFDKDKLKEETAFIFGFKDEVMPAKTAYQFSRTNEKLKILGGFIEKGYKEKEEMIALAQLPTRDELLAKMVGSLNAPVSGFYNVLRGNLKGLVYVLSQIKKA